MDEQLIKEARQFWDRINWDLMDKLLTIKENKVLIDKK